MPIRVPSGSERAPLQHMCVFERFCLNWANSAVDGFGNPICKFVRLPWNNNKDVSMLVSRFLFLLIFRSEHSCLGSENWGRILSASLLPREFTANTAFSGTSMPSRIKSSWEFQPHTLIGQIQPLMDLAIPFVNLFGYPGTTTKMCPCLFPGFFFC